MPENYFTDKETSCKCGCGLNIHPTLLLLLNLLRVKAGRPLSINSGARCAPYNVKIGGALNSQHVKRLAVDIHCTSDSERYELIKHAISLGFTGIGISRTFIHLDLRESTPVCFHYYKG